MKIFLIAFRGLGFRKPQYKNEPTLVKSGHVGIAFEENPDTIYGFHPTKESEDKIGGEEALIAALKNHERQIGTIQIDTEVFIRASVLAKDNILDGRTEVFILEYDYSEEAYKIIQDRFLAWHQSQSKFWYNFPNEDGKFSEEEFNCAVFPAHAGLEIPVYDGVINRYIEAMLESGAKQWQAPKS